jgi:flagellar assembly factor FliW
MSFKNIFLGFAFALIACSPSLQAKNYEFDLENPKEIEFQIDHQDQATLTIQNQSLVIRFKDQTEQVLFALKDTFLKTNQLRFEVEDFNSDGKMDLAFAVRVGLKNTFHQFYFYDEGQSRYVKFAEEMADYKFNKQQKQIESLHISSTSHKSMTKVYRFHQKKPYLYKEMTIWRETAFEKTIIWNPKKQILKKTLTSFDSKDEILGTIHVDKAYLYEKPLKSKESRMKAYLIKGDSVKILDVADQNGIWFFVEFQGQTLYQKWLPASSVSLSHYKNKT